MCITIHESPKHAFLFSFCVAVKSLSGADVYKEGLVSSPSADPDSCRVKMSALLRSFSRSTRRSKRSGSLYYRLLLSF